MVLRDRSGIKKPTSGVNQFEVYKSFNKIKHYTEFFGVKMRDYYADNKNGYILICIWGF